MSDSITINVIQEGPTNIEVNDTGQNIYLNPISLNQGIINHSVTHQSGGSDELLHNLLGGLYGGTSGQYYHLSSGQYFNLTTGNVVRPSETGVFYPRANPSGFIGSGDLTGYATVPFVTGISGYIQGQVNILNSQTGQYVLTGSTGAFYPRSNPSGYITGVDLNGYVTGDVVRPSQTGDFITTSQTGAFYPRSNPSGYITGVNLSGYVTGEVVRPSQTGDFITTGQTGAFYPKSNPSGFITGIDLSPYATVAFVTGVSGELHSQIENVESQITGFVTGDVVRPSQTGNFITTAQTGDFYPRSNPSGFITGVDLSGYVTGEVVRPSQTGDFYPRSNPSGFITGVDLSNYATIPYVTGVSGDLNNKISNIASGTGQFYLASNPSGFITGVNLTSYATISFTTGISGSLQNQITTLNNQTGQYVLTGSTGSFITQSQTGQFYAASNPSGFITGVDLSNYSTIAYVTGISGSLQSQIVTADPVRTSLTGNGSVSSYSISGASGLVNPSALIVAIDGALQEPVVDYTVSGGQITFTPPLASGSKAVVVAPTNVLQVSQMIPADGSVTSSKLDANIQIAGQLTNPNQTANTDYSVMNRLLGDSRYGNILLAVKSSDTARSNTTTFADDPHLSLNIPTTGLWEVTFFSFSTAADNTGGMKQQIAFSGTFNGPRSFIETRTNNQGVQFPAGSLTTLMRGGTAGAMAFPFQVVAATNRTVAACFSMLLDATATGTLKIQWAQNASSATATTLVGGSYLKAKKVG
jgi:hypothetical protein